MNSATLGDVADWGSGGTPRRAVADYFGDGVPWLSIAELGDGVVNEAKESLTPAGIANSSAKVVPAGTIFVAMYGSIGKLGIAGREMCTSQAIAFARPHTDKVDRRFLFHYLLAQRAALQALGRGGTQMNIGQADLKAWPIPLTPLPEQRRIAAILDHADTLRAQRRQVLAHLDTLPLSIFHDMFGGDAWRAVTPNIRDTDAHGWRWELLTDVAQLATGHTPDRRRADYWGGEIPWISLPDIRALDGQIARDTGPRITEVGIANSSAVVLPIGTVCFSRTASVGFVTIMGSSMATSQDFHNWVPGPLLDSAYLMQALRTSRAHLLGATDGSVHKTIYQRSAERFHVLLPPFELQREFARIAETVNAQRTAALAARTAGDELFASLQTRAFRGDL